MLFNSFPFLGLYLPIVFAVFFIIGKQSKLYAALWLAIASLFFYGYWNPKFTFLLLSSIGFNYFAGSQILKHHETASAKRILVVAISINLVLLGVFKYFNFFIETLNDFGAELPVANIILPLGISFFTFTQIAFLVDVYKGISKEKNFIHYLLFVTWFPHLIAGPVLHHNQMMPQFSNTNTYRIDTENIALGLTIFAIGIFKKVVLADNLSPFANSVFSTVDSGALPMLLESWVGILAYALQLYFDFSGYSDMAIGLSLLFNVRLPINFNSPYKAHNIIDFWRRWHMTLSKFLTDYLYIPLGGNRKGAVRRYLNLMTVMLLGGLWHGAGWNFVLWGGLHGIYLVINHGWRAVTGSTEKVYNFFIQKLFMFTTFFAVIFAWVPFRATKMDTTIAIWKGMLGLNGIALPIMLDAKLSAIVNSSIKFMMPLSGINMALACKWLVLALLITWLMPNTQQWVKYHYEQKTSFTLPNWLTWKPNFYYAVITGIFLGISILSFKKNSPFLYFQF